MPASPAVQGKCQLPSRVWPQTPSSSSERWGFRRSTCSAFPSAALSRRKSPFRRPSSSGAWFWSAPARAAAKAWRPSRQRRSKSSAPPMTIQDHLWLHVHFTQSEQSQNAGREFLKRFRLRSENRDPEVNGTVAPAQIEAIGKWGAPQEKPFEYLKSIRQPTLVVNGGKDVIIYSVNSFILQQHLPNAQLILYPDANHGSHYQYPKQFVLQVSLFLSEEE